MYAKLLSVFSVHFVLRPERHVLLYDRLPADSKGQVWPEWQCACIVAECRKVTVPLFIGGHRFDDDRVTRLDAEQLRRELRRAYGEMIRS